MKLSNDVVRAARKSFGACCAASKVAALIGREVALNISDYWQEGGGTSTRRTNRCN